MDKRIYWVVAGIAGLALLTIWIIDKSPMDGSFKSVAKRTVTTGSAMAVVGLLAALAVFGLPTPLGLLAAGSILVGSGAWAVTRHAVSGALTSETCPPGATATMVDGELWCTCSNPEGGISIFPAGTEPDTPCVT